MSLEDKNKKELFVKGLNWGSYSLSENKISFKGDSKDWFQIPFNYLANVQQGTNKNEITLEFNKDEDNDSAICELRLFVPDQETKQEKQKEKKKQKEENEKNENEENKNEENEKENEDEEEENKILKTRGELLKEEIIKLAGIGSISGSIAHIPEIQTVIPRGKFDLYFLKNSLKIHGQSHNYKTDIKNIIKVFLVPKIDGHFSFLILKLKSPLTQGNTTYPFVIFQIKPENKLKIDLQIPEDDEEIKKKLENLENPLEGKAIDVITKLFNNIVNKNLYIPSQNYTFSSKGPYIKCSYKANDGVLYFLEKTILFVHKPVLDIEHEFIKEIDFTRIHESGMQQRSFDMTIKLKEKESYQFSGLDREEMDNLQEYIKAKKIKLNNVDENNNNVDMPNYSTRKRAPVNEEIPDLPSEDELGDDDYSDSGEASGEDEDEEEEVENEDKKKKRKKGKKSEEE